MWMKRRRPVRIYAREHELSNELIGNLCMLANKRVAEFIGKPRDNHEKRTFVYRIQ